MNVKGMYKRKDDLNALIAHHNPDIISFTETKITSNIDLLA
jgi:exonuclease III